MTTLAPRHLAQAPGLTTVEFNPQRRDYRGRHRLDAAVFHSATQVMHRQPPPEVGHTAKMSKDEISAMVDRRPAPPPPASGQPYAVGTARIPGGRP